MLMAAEQPQGFLFKVSTAVQTRLLSRPCHHDQSFEKTQVPLQSRALKRLCAFQQRMR